MIKELIIYDLNDNERYIKACKDLEEVCDFLGCGSSILYKNLHLKGCMIYKNFKVELLKYDMEDLKWTSTLRNVHKTVSVKTLQN